MNKLFPLLVFSILLLVPVGSQDAFAVTETVFDEDFDGVLVGWIESLCNTAANGPIDQTEQTCIFDQTTNLFDAPNEPPISPPNWGFVEVFDDGGGLVGGIEFPVEVRFQKSFNVVTEDDYDISAVLGVKDCRSIGDCHIASRIYVDGALIFEQAGPDLFDEPPFPTHVFFEQSIIHLTPGLHNIELGMFSPSSTTGHFRGSFDDVLIQRELPVQVIGGEIIPIESASLILAGAQSFSWMIPVVLSVLGIGLFVFRKSENS